MKMKMASEQMKVVEQLQRQADLIAKDFLKDVEKRLREREEFAQTINRD